MNINCNFPCNASNYGGTRGAGAIQYIVMHYTGNKTDTAEANCKYFQGSNRQASAHYFVDENSIYMSVPEDRVAWSVGVVYRQMPYTNKCRNSNSINIEMCSRDGVIQDKTLENAMKLVQHLMRKYNIPADNLIRHWDVCGKVCPGWYGWCNGNDDTWNLFKFFTIASMSDNMPDPEPIPQPQPQEQVDWGAFVRWIIAIGQGAANEFVGHDFIDVDGIAGSQTARMRVRVLQKGLNLDYWSGLEEDGIRGAKTNKALKGHYVRKGECQQMVKALKILLALKGYGFDGGVNDYFDDSLEQAVRRYQQDNGLGVDGIAGYNTFISLVS